MADQGLPFTPKPQWLTSKLPLLCWFPTYDYISYKSQEVWGLEFDLEQTHKQTNQPSGKAKWKILSNPSTTTEFPAE